jgi:hypothetical protein
MQRITLRHQFLDAFAGDQQQGLCERQVFGCSTLAAGALEQLIPDKP